MKVPGRRLHLQDHQHQLTGLAGRHRGLGRRTRERVRDAGPQVVNDSKTPSGTVHVGSLRGPVILDAITRALRANGIETTLLYGVDDLDPMDAQALLTPDAIDDARWAARSPTCPTRPATATRRTRATTRRPSSTRSPASASTRTATTG